jgi:hypothetical protein
LDLHDNVKEELVVHYSYDQQIETEGNLRTTAVTVAGLFRCYKCARIEKKVVIPRVWDSYGISVKIWISTIGYRYRTRVYSQKCIRCKILVEPEVFKDDYVTKIVMALDRWTGLQSNVKPIVRYPKKGPHKTTMCIGCQKGICPLRLWTNEMA